MTHMILDALRQAWMNYVAILVSFVPRALATLSIVVAGWLMAFILRFLARRLLKLLRFNTLVQGAGIADVLHKAELPPPDHLVGSIIFWLVWIGFLLSGVETLGLKGVETLVTDFLHFVPRLFVALAIFAVGLICANFAWRATLLAAVNAKMQSARLVSGAVRLLLVILTVAMALDQIAVAQKIVLTAFAIAFGAVMLGVAIAIGIGGGPIARRILERRFPEKGKTETDESSHL